MQRPIAHQIIASSRPIQQSGWATAFVAALHIALIYALITGLTVPIIKAIPKVIDAIVLPPPTHPVHLPPPPLSSTPKLKVDTIPPPIVTIEEPQKRDAINVTIAPHPEPPAGTSSISPEPAHAVAGTHTTPDYPVLSRRLGEQGTVLLRIAIADNSQIENVNIVRSSGYSRLDDAAREWVMQYWRYQPATRDGKPVRSMTDASVMFNLKNAM